MDEMSSFFHHGSATCRFVITVPSGPARKPVPNTSSFTSGPFPSKRQHRIAVAVLYWFAILIKAAITQSLARLLDR